MRQNWQSAFITLCVLGVASSVAGAKESTPSSPEQVFKVLELEGFEVSPQVCVSLTHQLRTALSKVDHAPVQETDGARNLWIAGSVFKLGKKMFMETRLINSDTLLEPGICHRIHTGPIHLRPPRYPVTLKTLGTP